MTSSHWPEPDFFTLQQVSQRWVQWDCDESQLIQLCRSKKIEIGINLSPTLVKDESASHVFNNAILIEGFFALSIDDIERANDGVPTVTKKVYESKENKKPTSKKKPGASYQLMVAKQISPGALVITKAERDRFEKEHDLIIKNKENTQKTTNKPLSSREKNNLLRPLKAFCLDYKFDTSRSARTAESVIEVGDRNGTKMPSRSTMEKWIKELPDD